MRKSIRFSKLSGCGNDFVCLDSRANEFADLLADEGAVGQLARWLCRRGLSVGADGVIFAVPCGIEGVADIQARFFEADGSEAELCGNGVGCFTSWLLANGWVEREELRILTPAGVVRGARIEPPYTRVCIPLPEQIRRSFQRRI